MTGTPARRSPRATGPVIAALGLIVALCGGCALNVADTALSESTTSYWLWAEDKRPKRVFYPDDKLVTLRVNFAYNFVASTQLFRVEWLAPGSEPYVAGGVKTQFGSNEYLIVSLKLAGTSAATKFGLWQVRVYHGARLLTEAAFEVRPRPPPAVPPVPESTVL